MKHKHHIIPKHEGGSDEISNLVELTVTQHAMWHFAEWQRKGNWQDEKAWRGLAGLCPHEEVVQETMREGSKKAGASIRDRKVGIFGRTKDQHSSDSRSGRVKGFWYNNGTLQGKYFDPPEGWVPGRLKNSLLWWNDGFTNKRQVSCPGPGWVRGRHWVPPNKSGDW